MDFLDTFCRNSQRAALIVFEPPAAGAVGTRDGARALARPEGVGALGANSSAANAGAV